MDLVSEINVYIYIYIYIDYALNESQSVDMGI